MWMWSFLKSFTWQEENANIKNETESEENLDSLLLREEDLEDRYQWTQKEGIITELKDGYGRIDNEIYFSRDLKPKVSQGPLRVGDYLRYRAKRKEEHQAWKAIEILWASKKDDTWMEDKATHKKYKLPGDSVQIRDYMEEADNSQESDDSRQHTREVAKVIAIVENSVQVAIQTQDREEKLSFSLSQHPFPFALCVGDLICLEVKLEGVSLDDLSNLTIGSALPLRTQKADTAIITSWWNTQKKGIINNNIFFSPNVCHSGYSPRATDVVQVLAIECEPNNWNRKCNWRAYKVTPSKSGGPKQLNIQSLIHNPTKENALKMLLSNKNGIAINDNIDFGNIDVTKERTLTVQIGFEENRNNNVSQFLSNVKFQYPDPKNVPIRLCNEDMIRLPIDLTNLPFLTLHLVCSSKLSYGRNKILSIFEFYQYEASDNVKSKFNIGANLHITVSDPKCNGILNKNAKGGFEPVLAYKGDMILDESYDDCKSDQKVIKGPRNNLKLTNRYNLKKTATFLGVGPGAVVPKRLEKYELPPKMKVAAVNSDIDELKNLYPLLNEELCEYNYPEKWHTLLHIEEAFLLHRMRQYEMSNVVMREAGPQLLSLDVPGLAEKRPSLMLGDTAVVQPKARLLGDYRSNGMEKYEGVIEDVRSQSIILAFDDNFRRSYAGELVDVVFVLSRTNLRRRHVAADHCFKHLGKKILFPNEVYLLPPQVDFVTKDDVNKYDIKHLNKEKQSKASAISFNVIEYKKFGEERYSQSKPLKKVHDSRLSFKNENDACETSFSSASNETIESDTSLKFNDSNTSITCFNGKMSVAERLFKQATEAKGPKNFVSPRIPLNPYCWNACFELKDQKISGFKYEFIYDDRYKDVTMSAASHHDSFINRNTKKRFLPPYTPRHMKNNKTSLEGKPILTWVNKKLNPEQKSAVVRILAGEARPLPYIIYGPPGTGKTVTVVEAILQIFLLRIDSRILVTTPSNSSADLIAERLHNSGKIIFGEMARLNAMQRPEDSIPDLIRPYCFSNSDSEVLLQVTRHRIVIATCDTSGGIYNLGLTQGHFTHCVIDEAGETTEPQSMVPIGLLGMSSENDAQIILAGDPKQLGPVLQSNIAENCGLGESFLERLSRMEIYERDESRFKDHGNYDPVLCTKLIRNYRSHNDILSVSSDLFYDNELKAEASDSIKNAMLGCDFLPNEKCPLIFHGVRGQNIQEQDSPSWFNPAEALQVAKYLGLLLARGIAIEDVGIIAPYRKQTQKLRCLLESLNLPSPKVRYNAYELNLGYSYA